MRIEALIAYCRRYFGSGLRAANGDHGAADSTGRRRVYGQALVEFALLSPVLVMMVLGVIDLGRAFYTYEALANAAREGARYCALHAQDQYATNPATGTTDRVINEVSGTVTVTSSQVSTSPACTKAATTSGDPVTVTVWATFTPVTPLIGGFFPGGIITLTASATMMVQ